MTSPDYDRAWPYHASLPQRYSGNYQLYLARGGQVDRDGDVQSFVAPGATNHHDIGRFYFFSLILDQIGKEGLEGDIAELGVYKGHTASLLARIARRLNRTLYLLDTFEGFSTRDLQGIDSGGDASFSDTSVEQVRSLVGDENVVLVKGFFPDTAAKLPVDACFCVVHVDCDLYAPILSALKYFYPRLVPGGFLIIHDYSSLSWDGAEKAVDEFFADKPESIIPLTDFAGSAVIRKSIVTEQGDNWLLRKRAALLQQEWVSMEDGRGAALLGHGWSRPEQWGVWGLGDAHELHLALPPDIAEAVLEADVHVVLQGSRLQTAVDVFVSGTKQASWDFTSSRNRAIRSVPIPVPADSTSELAFVTVAFHPRSVERPCDFDDANNETRPLGLALHRLRVGAGPEFRVRYPGRGSPPTDDAGVGERAGYAKRQQR